MDNLVVIKIYGKLNMIGINQTIIMMIKINLLLNKKEGLLLITKEIILILKILQGAMGIKTFKGLIRIGVKEIIIK